MDNLNVIAVKVGVELSFWQAFKMRLAGINPKIFKDGKQCPCKLNTITPSQLAEYMHETYERESILVGWQTQASCNSKPFNQLPEKNKTVMLNTATDVIKLLSEHT